MLHQVQADVNITCFSYEGVDGIIPSLKAAQNLGTKEMPLEVPHSPLHNSLSVNTRSCAIQIHLAASPQYTLTTASADTNKATVLINNAIEVIKVEISKHGGECVVKTEARVVG